MCARPRKSSRVNVLEQNIVVIASVIVCSSDDTGKESPTHTVTSVTVSPGITKRATVLGKVGCELEKQ